VIGELPLSIFIMIRMLKSVTFVAACADIFLVHPVSTAVLAESVRVKHAAVMIVTAIRGGTIASK
jgi:hypothetical protein